ALERIRTALAAPPETPTGPRRLRVADVPESSIGAALQAISEQTGHPIDTTALGRPTLALSTSNLSESFPDRTATATFWEAINVVADGRFAVDGVRDGTVVLTESRPPPAAVAASGSFRVEIDPAVIRPGFGAAGSLIRVPVRVLAEPGVEPLSIRPVENGLVVRSGDFPLPAFSPDASPEFGFVNGTATFHSDRQAATGPVADLTVGGEFEVTTLPGSRTFTFPATAAGRSRQADGTTVRLDRVRKERDELSVSAAILFDATAGGSAFESYQTWRYAVGLKFIGADGETREPAAPPEVSAEGAAAVAARARFALPAEASIKDGTIEVTAPASPRNQTLRFGPLTVPVGTTRDRNLSDPP
ncbi:MAG: hypothetical protein AAF907_16040, partial [Planctomycetota bacterium]